MKKNFTTFMLLLVATILVIGIGVLGGAMYLDLVKEEEKTYQIGNIAVEHPIQEKNISAETQKTNISEIIQGTENQANSQSKEENQTNSNNSINNFFYNQLVGNQKAIYDKLLENKQNLRQGNYVINYGNAFSTTLSQENGGEQLGQDYQTAVEAFTHDNPDLFYLDVNKMYLNIETKTKFLRTTYNVFISAAQGATYLADDFSDVNDIENSINQIENIKNNIIKNLKGNDYKKIMTIHDYLVDNCEYDSTYKAKGSYSVYGALIGKTCVCEGYAKAFKYLANEANIKCEIMQGTATNSSGQTESHAWNCVKIDGTWYLVDSTWDDPIVVGRIYKGSQFKYKYFLKGTNTFNKDHELSYQFSENGKKFEYPTISKNDY